LRRTYFKLRRWTLLTAALLALSATAGVGSASAAWTKVAVWQMNEPSGATTMSDSSGNNRDGKIGSLVDTGVASDTRLAYEWTAGSVDHHPREERLVIVNGRAFNPRRDAFAVTVSLLTNETDQNIIQKGQSNTNGGMWKIETRSDGHAVCNFRGPAGRAAVSSRVSVADGAWHTVRCIRRRGGVTVIVDDFLPRKQAGRTGRIANDTSVAIGGKLFCPVGPQNVSCQDYVGLLDRVIVKRR
jgi:Laminin G domain